MKKFFFFLVFFPVIGMFNMRAQVPESGLVAFYPFTGNANDESGNNNNGVVDGATLTTDRFGQANSAYYFDGVNDRITVMNSDLIDFDNSEDFTIALWMKSSDTRMVQLINKQYPGYWNGYLVVLNSDNSGYCTEQGHILFYAAAGAKEDACSDEVVNNNEWVFVTGVYDHEINAVKLYINGIQQSDIGASSGNIKTTQNLQIGYGLTLETGYVYYKGIMDDIRLFNRMLNDQEITALYHEGEEDVISGLVAFYPFTGNANDESGNNNNGVVDGATLTTDRCGNENCAYYFDGVDDEITVPNNDLIDFSNSEDFTVTCWINTTDDRWVSVINKQYPGYWNGYYLELNNGDQGYCTRNGHIMFYAAAGANEDACSDGIVNNGEWKFIAGVYNSVQNKVYLYIDGILQADIGKASGDINTLQDLLIGYGYSYDPGNHHYKGSIDDIRIYNRTLSDQEIVTLYNDGCNNNESPDPLAYYPFTGNANDESGNGHDGLMHNVTMAADRCGNENSACYFNGYDSYIELTNTCGLNMFDGFSLAAWVNFTETNGSSIVSKHVNYYANGFTMSACDNIFNLTTNNNQYYLSTSETYNDGNWYFTVGTFNGNTLSIYVDGQLKASAAADYTTGNGINIRIGADYYLSFFNGLIDEVMIFDRALSQSEVTLLYGEAACQQNIPETEAGTLNIFPNPAREQIIVHIDNVLLDKVLKLEIRNILGQIVYTAPVVQAESVIDISSWIGYGIYFIRLKDPEGEIVKSRKLLLF